MHIENKQSVAAIQLLQTLLNEIDSGIKREDYVWAGAHAEAMMGMLPKVCEILKVVAIMRDQLKIGSQTPIADAFDSAIKTVNDFLEIAIAEIDPTSPSN